MQTNRTLRTYLSLCSEYYDLDKPNAPAEDLAFYLNYGKQTQGLILEPMCGTGRFLIPFLQAGLNIEGFDASPWMLEALRKKCKAQNLNPKLWEGFLQDLQQPQAYEVIFIPSASFGLVTDLQEAKTCLQKIHAHLGDDGLFVFETETPAAAPRPYSSRTRTVTREDGKKIELNILALPLEDQVATTSCRYDLVDNDQVIHSENETFKVRLYEPEQICAMLQQAGFSKIKVIKAFDTNKTPDPQDGVIAYECHK